MNDRLMEEVSREAVARVNIYIDLLESTLDGARRARDILQGGVSLGKEFAEGPGVINSAATSGPGASPPAEPSAGSEQVPESGETGSTDSSADSIENLKAALDAAARGKRLPVIELLRVIARANGGRVRLNEANTALRELKLTKSSRNNLPGYMIKKMQLSGEFEREEDLGRGIYRWLRYVDPVPDLNSSEIVGGEAYSAPPALSGDVDERDG